VEGLSVVGTGLRLLGRHWPVLLALYLGGVIAHGLAMRAAVRVSLVNAELGMLVLLLAPMATLSALVLMLRAVRPSLPWLGGAGKPASVLAHLGSVLVPFLTIYYFEDYLNDDLSDYAYQTWLDDTERIFAGLGEELETGAGSGPVTTADRLPFDLTLALAVVVVAAIVGRWLLSRWGRNRRRPWLGIPGAYLELVWLTLVYLAFLAASELIVDWGGNRQVVHGIQAVWDQAVGTASGVAPSSERATAWFMDKLGYADAVLVIPISWLAIGAVVLGHRPAAVLPAAAARAGRGGALIEGLRHRWAAAPGGVRWVGEKLTDDLRERFTPLVRGTRLLARAGLAPMLLFCLAFVAARTVADWLWELQRLLIGPEDLAGFWMPLSWPLSQLNSAVSHVVMVCLLAAAVDRALHPSQGDPAPPDPPDPPDPAGTGRSRGPGPARRPGTSSSRGVT
jgi:hypothetical protein